MRNSRTDSTGHVCQEQATQRTVRTSTEPVLHCRCRCDSLPQARLLCLSLGEAFCADDAAGQQAAAELLRDTSCWAADDRLQVGGAAGADGGGDAA